MEPSAWFVVVAGPDAGRQIPVPGPEACLGRSTQCEIALADERASRQHASVRQEDWGWIIVDLNSTNGTFVNGHRLLPNIPHVLHMDDQVQVADTVLSFQEACVDREVWDDGLTDPGETGPAGERGRTLVRGRTAVRGIHPLLLAMAVAACALLSAFAVLAILVLKAI